MSSGRSTACRAVAVRRSARAARDRPPGRVVGAPALARATRSALMPSSMSPPGRSAPRGRRPHAQRIVVPHYGHAGVLQALQGGPQFLGRTGHPVPGCQQVGGVRDGGAQHGEDTERLRLGPHRLVQGAERERQTGRELGIAAHRLSGVRKDHLYAQPIGVGGGERAVPVQPPPGTEQGPGQPGEHGQPQQPGCAGPQIDPARLAAGGADRLRRGIDQQLRQPSRRRVCVLGAPSHRPYLVRAPSHGRRHSQKCATRPPTRIRSDADLGRRSRTEIGVRRPRART
jgi:hypothetical protein